MICGGPGVSDAYYCKECTVQEKDVSSVLFLFFVFFTRLSQTGQSDWLILSNGKHPWYFLVFRVIPKDVLFSLTLHSFS